MAVKTLRRALNLLADDLGPNDHASFIGSRLRLMPTSQVAAALSCMTDAQLHDALTKLGSWGRLPKVEEPTP
jgi:hypothetical protein